MDLIHAKSDHSEVGILTDFVKVDFEICSDEASVEGNSFEIIMDEDGWKIDPLEIGDYIYSRGEEWGGRIEQLKHSTSSGEVTVTGICWRGMLARKVIEPPSGEAYLRIRSIEANAAIRQLLSDKFGDFFIVPEIDTGVTVSGDFRYTNLLQGIYNMLSSAGCRLECGYDNIQKKVVIQAERITDYSGSVEISQDYGIYMSSTAGRIDAYNHIIALGRGELTEREVIHLYRLDDGTITQTDPGNRGENDICEIYDYSNAESTEELIKGATKRLRDYTPTVSVNMDIAESGLQLMLGDKVAARDYLTGVTAVATVLHQIMTVTATEERIETEVG